MFSFGHTMHNTLYNFLKIAGSAEKSSQKDLFGKTANGSHTSVIDFKQLTEIYEKNWVDEWYESKNNRDDYYKLGKKIIKDFYEDFCKNPPNVLKINDAPALETSFNLKINGNTLIGKIDRIDDLGDGTAIIDYKTGTSKDKPEKEQLLIYQMAAEEVLHIKPKQLLYYYLEDGKRTSFLGSQKDIKEQKEKIIEIIEKIKSSQFEPTPGWNCQHCDFKDICDFAQR